MGKAAAGNPGSSAAQKVRIGGGTGRSKSATSKSAKAGLVWPVARVNNKIIKEFPKSVTRVGAGAPVFVAAIVEYIMAEIIELSINQAQANKRQRITVPDIMTAIRNDPALHKAMHGLVFMTGDKQKRPADFITTKYDAEQKLKRQTQGATEEGEGEGEAAEA